VKMSLLSSAHDVILILTSLVPHHTALHLYVANTAIKILTETWSDTDN